MTRLEASIKSFVLASMLAFSFGAWAEPWMANRFAENCATCHSPGRRDVSSRDRRCTLTCQSCHTNPSGGGLRNHHGTWTQQRWLRSKKGPKILSPKGIPAPLKFQKYAKMPSPLTEKDLQEAEAMAVDGARLAVIPGVTYSEANYKDDGQSQIMTQSQAEFMARVTDLDPLRTEAKNPWSVGADLKYLVVNGERDASGPSALPDEDLDYKVPMFFDIGVRYRPVPKKVQLVFEHRYYNSEPTNNASRSDPLWATDGSSINRSAYILFDELPYNSHIMYGNYQPMFGHNSGEYQNLLSNIITSQEDTTTDSFSTVNMYRATNVYRAVSFGTAARIPFFNFHWIKPRKNSNPQGQLSPEPASAEGFAANAGLHFQTLGASLLASYWSTKSSLPTATRIQRDMISLSGGLHIRKWIVQLDLTEVERAQNEKHKGQVQTLEGQYRYFRENYAVISYATANTSRNLKKGKSTETTVGLKSYYNPGTKFEFLYIIRDDRNSDTADQLKSSQMQLLAHLYF